MSFKQHPNRHLLKNVDQHVYLKHHDSRCGTRHDNVESLRCCLLLPIDKHFTAMSECSSTGFGLLTLILAVMPTFA